MVRDFFPIPPILIAHLRHVVQGKTIYLQMCMLSFCCVFPSFTSLLSLSPRFFLCRTSLFQLKDRSLGLEPGSCYTECSCCRIGSELSCIQEIMKTTNLRSTY
ncbi:hypothetical protein SETIT_3G367400v2 [Setaria italica]|uniref:Uncharacterized protein n=1 Tax=Setaria italica TaxID=4555 RepID=A0A368QMN4_SETIT|nr:hypothetical protein SETIT_3G367400v2 [Setaria italica]